MPELPEVETTRRGIAPHVEGRIVSAAILRRPDLRWPIPPAIRDELVGARIDTVDRRAKYLLLRTERGSAIVHLGMTGTLRVLASDTPAKTHDHVDLQLDSGTMLRLTDPRRFGCLLWQPPGETHPLLADLGPEPLSDAFDGAHLYARSRGKTAAVKVMLMDQAVVVGVGNIYASESLYSAGIRPDRAAGTIGRARYDRLAVEAKRILQHSITRGGTTLRDFLAPDGAPGYFEQELQVYGREGDPCRACGSTVRGQRLGQRATFFCARCQK
ncbi:MAG: bifunctional DNA-formamidopyrimidine glycosylase/DNA-(apurinic or apyrimidinic site) lyase [Proteobacteria bacterium]|nr:MAG: bifunctional DNA-formamidopyrimidine glycosylase/DNA-(apurinic or apyrimidinic site) lyase [Pseudomonadota bacterium]